MAGRFTRSWAFSAGLMAAAAAQGNPQGPQVMHGSARFERPAAHVLEISNSPGAIIHWQSFGIAGHELTQFIQQGPASAVLNRVTGEDPSAIFGQLHSNGRVFLINPNGIAFGPNAVVDTAGLVASSLNISDADFLRGELQFAGAPDAGAVVNEGVIRTAAGGAVALIGPRVENHGVIETPEGEIVLAAGQAVRLASLDDGGITFEVQAPEDQALNLGRLSAPGGAVGVFAGTLRHSGEIDASAVALGPGGRVELVAAQDASIEAGARVVADGAAGGTVRVESHAGETRVGGAIEARGTAGEGGFAHVLGERVVIAGTASVDVSGAAGGGEVLVGGGLQGRRPEIRNAAETVVETGAAIRADALEAGDGGEVIVWSDGVTAFGGAVRARGGATAGDGGFAEISGKQRLVYRGGVDVTAANGAPGAVLFDPKFIVIANIGGAGVSGDLPISANDEFTDNATATVTFDPADVTAITNTGAALTLQANTDIRIDNTVTTNNPSGTGGAITLRAGRSVIFNGDLTTDGGNLTVVANDPVALGSDRDAGAAEIRMNGTIINVGTGSVDMDVSGFTGFATGDIVIEDIIAGDVSILNAGDSPGSDILRASPNAVIQANSVHLEVEFSDGSIGTAAEPIVVSGFSPVNVEAHTHLGGSIDIVSLTDTNIGGVSIFGGAVRGLQTEGGGSITLDVTGSLTLLGGAAGCGPTGGTGGPVCTAGDAIELMASGPILVNQELRAAAGGDVTLHAGGPVADGTGGIIDAGNLVVTAVGGITLGSPSGGIVSVAAASLLNTGGGSILFVNSGKPLLLTNLFNPGFAVWDNTGGGIDIRNDDDLTLDAPVQVDGAGLLHLETNGGTSADLTVAAAVTQTGSGTIELMTSASAVDPLLTIATSAGSVTTPGDVLLASDDMAIDGPVSAGTITVQPANTGVAIELGTAGEVSPGVLELSDTELNNLLAAGTLQIGFGVPNAPITVTAPVTLTSITALELDAGLGPVDFDADLTLTDPGAFLGVTALGSGTGEGVVRDLGGGDITVNELSVFAAQAVLLGTGTHAVGIFSAVADGQSAGGVTLNNAGPLALGPVTANTFGDITITNLGDVQIAGNVDATAGGVSITATGGDIDGDPGTGVVRGGAGDVTLDAVGIGTGVPVRTSTAGVLSLTTSGNGAAGDIYVEETSGPARFLTTNLSVTTDPLTGQTVELTFPQGLVVDGALGVASDDLVIRTPGRDIEGAGGTLTANNLTLDTDGGIGTSGPAVLTQANQIAATVASGGRIAIDNTGAVTFTALTTLVAGDVLINQTGGSGAVTIAAPVTSGGVTRIRAASPLTVNADISSPGSVLLETVGLPGDVTVNAGVLVDAFGLGSGVTINSAEEVFINGTLRAADGGIVISGTNVFQNGILQAADGPITVNATGFLGGGALGSYADAGLGAVSYAAGTGIVATDIAGGTLAFTTTTGDISLRGTVADGITARQAGLPAGTPAIDIDAPAGDVFIELDPGSSTPGMTTTSGAIVVTGELVELDDGDDDTFYRAGGDVIVNATAFDVTADASARLEGESVTVTAAGGIDGLDATARSGPVLFNAAGGNADSLGDLLAATDVTVTASGSIDLETAIAGDGLVTLTAATGDVDLFNSPGLVVESSKTGLLPGQFAIDIQAGTTVRISGIADLRSLVSGGIRIQAPGRIDLDGSGASFTNISAPGDVEITSFSGDVDRSFGAGANITGANVSLTAGNVLDLPGAFTATSGDVVLFANGDLTHTGPITAANDVSVTTFGAGDGDITGTGNVTAGNLLTYDAEGDIFQNGVWSAADVDLAAGADIFHDGTIDSVSFDADLMAGGSILGTGDVFSGASVFLDAGTNIDESGMIDAGVDVDMFGARVTTSGDVSAASGDIFASALFEVTVDGTWTAGTDIFVAGGGLVMGPGGTLTAAGRIDIEVDDDVQIGLLDAPVVNLDVLGDVLDANGPAVNVSGTGLLISDGDIDTPNALGTAADPLETSVDLFDVVFNLSDFPGGIFLANDRDLTVLIEESVAPFPGPLVIDAAGTITFGNLFTYSGSVTLRGTGISVPAGTGLSGFFGPRSPAVLLDAGAGLLAVDGGRIEVVDLTLRGGDLDLYSADVDATGDLVVDGDVVHVSAGTSAPSTVLAGGDAVISATDFIVEGGPAFGDLARVAAGGLLQVAAQNVSVLGGGDFGAHALLEGATVDITAGTTALPGAVDLQPGLADADGVIVAGSGTGPVTIAAGTCNNCVLLASDPFANSTPEAGIFAASFTFNQLTASPPPPPPPPPPPSPPPPSSAPEEPIGDPGTDEVLILEALFEVLEESTAGFGSAEEDEEEGEQVLVCR